MGVGDLRREPTAETWEQATCSRNPEPERGSGRDLGRKSRTRTCQRLIRISHFLITPWTRSNSWTNSQYFNMGQLTRSLAMQPGWWVRLEITSSSHTICGDHTASCILSLWVRNRTGPGHHSLRTCQSWLQTTAAKIKQTLCNQTEVNSTKTLTHHNTFQDKLWNNCRIKSATGGV